MWLHVVWLTGLLLRAMCRASAPLQRPCSPSARALGAYSALFAYVEPKHAAFTCDSSKKNVSRVVEYGPSTVGCETR